MVEYHALVICGHVIRFRFRDAQVPRIKAYVAESDAELQEAFNREYPNEFSTVSLDDCMGAEFMRFIQWLDKGDRK